MLRHRHYEVKEYNTTIVIVYMAEIQRLRMIRCDWQSPVVQQYNMETLTIIMMWKAAAILAVDPTK